MRRARFCNIFTCCLYSSGCTREVSRNEGVLERNGGVSKEGRNSSRCGLQDLSEDVLLGCTEVLLCELPERVRVGFVGLAEEGEEVRL